MNINNPCIPSSHYSRKLSVFVDAATVHKESLMLTSTGFRASIWVWHLKLRNAKPHQKIRLGY